MLKAILLMMLVLPPMLLAEDARPVTDALFRNQGEGFVRRQSNPELDALLAKKPELDAFETAAVGDRKQLDRLLRKDPGLLTARNSFGWTLLHFAAFAGNAENVALLLDRGADIRSRAKTKFRNTPLQVALLTGEYDAAKLLLERGADPLDRQAKGFTPMHEAASLGRIDLLELLMAHGAEVNSRSDDGRTPLTEALRGKHQETADFIRAHGGTGDVTGVTQSPD